MAEIPSDQSPAGIQPQSGLNNGSPQYWCYQCQKLVAVEALAGEFVCYECKAVFVETVPAAAVPAPTPDNAEAAADLINRPNFGQRLIQVLSHLSQVPRDEDAPPLPQHSDEGYPRVELNGLDNNNNYEDDDYEHSMEVIHEDLAYVFNMIEDGSTENNRSYGEAEGEINMFEDGSTENNRSYGEAEGEINMIEDEDDLERRRRREREINMFEELSWYAHVRGRRVLDWQDVLLGMNDLPSRFPEFLSNLRDPGYFLSSGEYEDLLQRLADTDNTARHGAPPAAKSAIKGLENMVIENKDKAAMCAICKDTIILGESVKNLPCGHVYHGDCILPWLETRNSCPVCRFELPTDDPEYEEERKRRAAAASLRARSFSSSSADSGASDAE